MMTKLSIFILLLISTVGLSGQSIHELSTKKESILIGSGLAGLGLAFPIGKNIKPLTKEEIDKLNPLAINGFDRISTTTYSAGSRKLSDRFLQTSFAVPFALLLDQESRDEYETVGLMYFETILLTNTMTGLSKAIFRRTRPYAYNKDVDFSLKLGTSTRLSFFSGHTSNVAAAAFFSAKVFADNNPGSNMKTVYWSTAAIVPAIQGFLRVKGGKHFPSDVIAGYIVGALAGILVPQLHK